MKYSYIILLFAVIVSCKKEKSSEPIRKDIEINIEVSSNSIIMGDSITFKVIGSLPNTKIDYHWILNGAVPNISTSPNPKVKYKTNGTYDVKLIVKYDGKSDTIIKSNIIKVESTITEGLIAYYPFNGNAKDMTGKGHDGTAQNAALTTDRFGNENAAFIFNGTNSSILVKDKADLRLSQTDFDGQTEKLKILASNCKSNVSIQVVPNPNNGDFAIYGLEEGDDISIVNNLGQNVYTATATTNFMAVDLKGLNSGIYFVQLKNESKTEIVKVQLNK